MNEEELKELIQLYSAGCITKQDLQKLNSSMQEDKNFPWSELSEYQNLVALLFATLKTEEPTVNARNKVVYKMNELAKTHPRNNIENHIPEGMVQNVPASEGKIDWGSLSTVYKKIQKSADVLNSDQNKEYIPVQPLSQNIAESKINFDEISDEPINLYKETSSNKYSNTQRRFKKYHFAVAGLILASILFGGYLYLGSRSEVKTEFLKVKTEQLKVSVKETKTDTTENIIGVVSVGDPEPVVEKENEPQKQVMEELLPTPPPETVSSIKYPTAEFIEYVPIETSNLIEETKTENQKPIPPPEEESIVEEEPIYFVAVEEMPKPIGGLKSIQEKIVYPEIARRAGIEGKVFVRAYVDETGSVTQAEVIKGIGLGCDEAALDAVLNTKFTPGKQRGKLIKVQVIIPIIFKL